MSETPIRQDADPRPREPFVWSDAWRSIGVGAAILLLGVLAVWVGRRRAQWRRDLAAWEARHPEARRV